MACARFVHLRISLLFAVALQVLHGLHGYAWWLLFSGLGLWSLAVPATTTYGGAAMVMWDDSHGYQYTSEWARVLTAAFLAFSFTAGAVTVLALATLVLDVRGLWQA